MTGISLPAPPPAQPEYTVPKEVRERALRGLSLFKERAGEIENRRGVYYVPSCSDPDRTHEVHLGVWGEGESCSCKDRAPVCKHLIAATIARAKHLAASSRRRGPRRSAAEIEGALRKMGA